MTSTHKVTSKTRKSKKLLIIVGAASLSLAACAGGTLNWADTAAKDRIARSWDVSTRDFPIPFPLDEAERAEVLASHEEGAPTPDFDKIARKNAEARGRYLVETRLGCIECHKKDLAGGVVVDDAPVWRWVAPNITTGGRTAEYQASDWDRILRHGVKKDGTAALMPAEDFAALSDREVSDIATYVRSLPASEVVREATQLGPVGKVLFATGKMPIAAEDIDHDAARRSLPPSADAPDYGEHLAQTCVGCHRADFTGGTIRQGPPDWPAAANLTASIDAWTKDDFTRALREGKRPDGSAISEVMPWRALGEMSDTDLNALYSFLMSLEAKESH